MPINPSDIKEGQTWANESGKRARKVLSLRKWMTYAVTGNVTVLYYNDVEHKICSLKSFAKWAHHKIEEGKCQPK